MKRARGWWSDAAYGLPCIGEEGVLPATLWWYPYGDKAEGSFWGADAWIPQKLFLLEFNIRACRFNNSNKLVAFYMKSCCYLN